MKQVHFTRHTNMQKIINCHTKFVVEDNNMSTNTPTNKVWIKKSKKEKILFLINIKENIRITELENGFYFNDL